MEMAFSNFLIGVDATWAPMIYFRYSRMKCDCLNMQVTLSTSILSGQMLRHCLYELRWLIRFAGNYLKMSIITHCKSSS